MSVDLSSPEITSVCHELVDASARTTWFYLHYHPTQDRSLVLNDRGCDPLVQGWQNCIRASADQVGFGYGILGKNRSLKEGGERGVVLLYLPNNVTRDRTALTSTPRPGDQFIPDVGKRVDIWDDRCSRTVVHSRAVANLFPNYSAIITISSPDEISDAFLQEHTNFHNHSVPTPSSSPVKVRPRPSDLLAGTDVSSGLGGGIGLGRPSHLQGEAQRHVSGVDRSASTSSSRDKTLPPPPVEPLDIPQPVATPPPRTGSPAVGMHESNSASGSGSFTGTGGSGGGSKGLGISSVDVFGRTERKESLGSRLARAIPIGGSPSADRGGAPASPSSPGGGGHKKRFSIDNLTKSFGQGQGLGHASPSSPRIRDNGHARVPSGHINVPPEDAHLMRNVSESSREMAAGRMDPSGDLSPPASPRMGTEGENSVGAGASGARRRVPSLARLFPSPGSRRHQEASPASPRGAPGTSSGSGVPFPTRDVAAQSSSPSISLGAPISASSNSAPPLPPKDTHPTGRYGIGQDTPLIPSQASYDYPTDGADGPIDHPEGTGAAALHAASDNQIRAEEAQHEQYRRGEEEKARIRLNSGNRSARVVGTPTLEVGQDELGQREGIVGVRPQRHLDRGHAGDDEEEEGLPYDREDHEPAASARSSGHRVCTPPVQPPRGPVPEYSGENDSRSSTGAVPSAVPASATTALADLVAARPDPGVAVGPMGSEAEPEHTTSAGNRGDRVVGVDQEPPVGADADESVTASFLDETDTQADDSRAPIYPAADASSTPHVDPDTTNRLSQATDAATGTTTEVSLRQAAEEAERSRLSAAAVVEPEREAEEARVRIAEAEAAVLQKERLEREKQEEERLELERQAKVREEEYEREQAAKRLEQERLDEEKRTREAEEAKHAAELAFEDNLRALKGSGEMLRGFVTVQTPKSMIWRRRWYALYANELKLYKAEGDEKPIQTIPLLGSRVSEKFDDSESQVHDSFKITSTAQEDFYLFTDSPEDKAALLRGLRVALE